jgi:hypothetical protein
MRTRESLRRERMESVSSVLVELFISVKKVEGRTPKTTSWYRSMLNRFVAFTGDPKLGSLALDDARRFVASLPSRTKRYVNHPVSPEEKGGLSPQTISCYWGL